MSGNFSVPPPFPVSRGRPRRGLNRFAFIFAVVFGVLAAVLLAGFFFLSFSGRSRVFAVPTNGMAPAIIKGDHILMNGYAYRHRSPARGDIVCFKSDAVLPPQRSIYVRRVAGLPGDVLTLTNGGLFLNGEPAKLRNAAGEIEYSPIPGAKHLEVGGAYFLLGDNTLHSFDSRFFGAVPADAIIGKAIFCCFPIARTGQLY